jgi:hypothetical protein
MEYKIKRLLLFQGFKWFPEWLISWMLQNKIRMQLTLLALQEENFIRLMLTLDSSLMEEKVNLEALNFLFLIRNKKSHD